jgi:hypothetical protein
MKKPLALSLGAWRSFVTRAKFRCAQLRAGSGSRAAAPATSTGAATTDARAAASSRAAATTSTGATTSAAATATGATTTDTCAAATSRTTATTSASATTTGARAAAGTCCNGRLDGEINRRKRTSDTDGKTCCYDKKPHTNSRFHCKVSIFLTLACHTQYQTIAGLHLREEGSQAIIHPHSKPP